MTKFMYRLTFSTLFVYRVLESFKNISQKLIEQVSTVIQHQTRLFVIDKIKYHKLGDGYYYATAFCQSLAIMESQ